MNMGGGENYQHIDNFVGTPTQVEGANAQQNVPSPNPLEQQETGKTIETSEPATLSSVKEENFIENAEVKKDNVEPSQNVSTETASVGPLPESVGTSKPEDTTGGETTQQTAVDAAQVAQVTSQQIWEY